MKIENQSISQHHPIDIKIKLACLWASLMFCYIYCDYFELYSAGKIEALIQGKSMLDTPNKVLMAAVMMSIPALMISLSIFLKPVINKILNIFISLFFACLLTMIAVSLDAETHGFYIYFAIIEIILTLFISYTAYKWPKQTPN
ncbi:MAG TPA: DUF6326 family protein [Saprospiraceae bacterium]|nr:DUF6326 family protein [Saprospiraceae bacterium]HMU03985.1 DUF6326 family protein [Saprospiraceae bacterium]